MAELQGTYLGTVVDVALGQTKSGTDQVQVVFEIRDPADGFSARVSWFGFFTEKAFGITDAGLKALGFDLAANGWNLELLNSQESPILGVEAQLVIEMEEYEGKRRPRIKFINRPGQSSIRGRLDAAEVKSMAARVRASMGSGAAPAPAAAPGAPSRAAARGQAPAQAPAQAPKQTPAQINDDEVPF